jgi:hypothetical protein
MAMVVMVKGVVIIGRAYQAGQMVDLKGADLEVALSRGYAKLCDLPAAITPPPQSPIKPKRGKKS